MANLSADDKTRLMTKLEGLRARIAELKADGNIEPNTKRQMISVRERVCTDLEAALKLETPK